MLILTKLIYFIEVSGPTVTPKLIKKLVKYFLNIKNGQNSLIIFSKVKIILKVSDEIHVNIFCNNNLISIL